jgi:hypothetical protein
VIHHIKETKNQNRPHTKTPRQMLEAKLHEAISLACEQIAVMGGLELERKK